VAVCADGPNLRIALASVPDCVDAPAIGGDTRGRMIWDGIAPAKLSQPLLGLSKDGALPALAVIRSAQIAGALNRCLELSVDYAGLRSQFGRPIGKFQAVQQMAAKLALETAAAKAAADFGLRTLHASPMLASGSAKVRASRAAGLGAGLAHQIHGAIGVTEEHALQLYTRRLWQWRDEAGSEHHWSERLGRHAIDYGAPGLWAGLIDELDRTGDASNG
jgi:acyl-CoA dehydrogenase